MHNSAEISMSKCLLVISLPFEDTGRRLGMGVNMYPSYSLLSQLKDDFIASLYIAELRRAQVRNSEEVRKEIYCWKADIGIAVANATDDAIGWRTLLESATACVAVIYGDNNTRK